MTVPRYRSRRTNRCFAVILATALAAAACSPYKIARAPGRSTLPSLIPGTPRADVLRELGTPDWSRTTLAGLREDSWVVVGGPGPAWRTATTLYAAIIDVSTVGLWELREYRVAPADRVMNEPLWLSEAQRVTVAFDSQDRVAAVTTTATALPIRAGN